MKWFYIWSEKYRDFHNYIQDVIPHDKFDVHAIYIPQERFDKGLYQKDGLHPWTGCNIKMNEIIRILEELEDGEVFLFTDADMVIRPNSDIYDVVNFYRSVIDIDMVFSPEAKSIQISSMLLRKTPLVLAFWKRVLELCIEFPTKLDQNIIIEELRSYKGKWLRFSDTHILNCFNINQGANGNIRTFLITNLLVNCSTSEFNFYWKKREFNIMLNFMHDNGIINEDYKNKYWMTVPAL
jgi:hypothetical protein